jgi:hypothetical protein
MSPMRGFILFTCLHLVGSPAILSPAAVQSYLSAL